jgi:hypothetical protein
MEGFDSGTQQDPTLQQMDKVIFTAKGGHSGGAAEGSGKAAGGHPRKAGEEHL